MKRIHCGLFFLSAFSLMVFTGCGGAKSSVQAPAGRRASGVEKKVVDENVSEEVEDEITFEDEITSMNPAWSDLSVSSDKDVLELLKHKSLNQNAAAAHKQYLDDDMVFSEYDLQGFQPDDYVAVVCSDECEFFTEDLFEVDEDNYTLNIKDQKNLKGEHIPLGTMIPLSGRYSNSDKTEWYSSYCGYFYLWNNYNYFHETTWNGKKGFVFGADIEVEGYAENVAKYAEKYLSNGRSDVFYPVLGLENLSENEKESLEENRITLESVEVKSYFKTEEFIDYYNNLLRSKEYPLFITTDLVSHTQHTVFDRMLQKAEEDYFEPRLLSLTQNFIAALNAKENVPEDMKTKAIEYFQVPELILRSAPVKKEQEEWPYGFEYVDVDNSGFIGDYSKEVQEDYEQVMNASGTDSKIFTFNINDEEYPVEEDFTQYKPRGHYTKNGILEAYFRAEMWYGRIHFCIADSGYNGVSDWQTTCMEPIAMLIVDTVKDNPELYQQWADLFDPITELIGLSDDLGFNDVLPLWKNQNVSDFTAWASDEEKLTAFVKLCHEKLRPPAISGNSSLSGPVEGESLLESKPAMGWRLLGQRFTWDSYVHEKVSAPRLYPRDYVRGLDIMKAFGSSSADALLAAEDYRDDLVDENHPYVGGSKLKEILDFIEKEFNEKPDDFWTETYYNNILAQIKAQADFESGAGYYFTESPLWNIKSLNAASCTWAELRHDTILYVKQVYGERAGGDDIEATYRTKPFPEPVNYIEPNIPFWTYGLASINGLSEVFTKYGILDEETKVQLEMLMSLYKNALEISQLEAQDKPVSEAQNKWIRNVPSLCNKIYEPNPSGGMESSSDDQLKMACIADVYTNADYGEVLEVGVARPLKMLVALNDGQGGKRIAVGYVPSYCEFYHDQNDRMTDEQWKQIVYDENTDMTEYYPEWMQGCVIQK